MRLGGPILEKCADPGAWAEAHKKWSYTAAFFPLDAGADDATIQSYVDAAAAADILIAEVGAWSNPISPDDDARKKALAYCQGQLALADRVGARCCVNIAGSRALTGWYDPHPDNLTEDTFDLVVESVRTIIDAVKPGRTYYALEPMAWAFPDSPDSYVRIIKAIDRDRFGAHLDPTNFVTCPRTYFENANLLRECFEKLGPRIRSCHGKDIVLRNTFNCVLEEVPPGLGALDYTEFLRGLDKLDPDMPLMMEHWTKAEDYEQAVQYVRNVAETVGATIR